MKKYTEFDAALLLHISTGAKTLEALNPVLKELAKPHCIGSTPTFRIIDRRLQALRKTGLIVYNSKTGWSIVS